MANLGNALNASRTMLAEAESDMTLASLLFAKCHLPHCQLTYRTASSPLSPKNLFFQAVPRYACFFIMTIGCSFSLIFSSKT
jgi:hypothetical protein